MLKWNGTAWACSTDNNSGGTISTLTAGTGITITNPSGPNATINATNNGTLTGITAGTGATVSGSAPSPTINVTDLYVNTTGDTMTGQLRLTANNTQTGGSFYAESTAPADYTNCDSSPSACGIKGMGKEAGIQGIGRIGVWGIANDYGATGRAISAGYFANPSGTIYASLATPNQGIIAQNSTGWGGFFWGLYGVYGRGSGTGAKAIDAYIGNDVTNGHAGYFDAQNALGTSYGLYVRGPSTGAAGRFVDAGTNRAVELASQSTNLALSVAGNTRLGATNDTTTVSGTLTLIAPTSRLCLGTSGGVPDCRTSWPSGGLPGGANTNIQFNNSGSFGGDSNFIWDNTNKRLGLGTASPANRLQVSGNIRADNSVQFNNVISAYNTANYSFAGYFQSSGNGAYGIDARSNTACGGVFNFMNATADPVNQVLAGCGSTAGALSVSVSDSSLATSYAIATNGNVYLGGGAGGGTAANTGNLYLPNSGGIGFDGNRDNTAFLQLFSDNNFYWDLGTANRLRIRSSGGVTTYYDFNGGSFTATGAITSSGNISSSGNITATGNLNVNGTNGVVLNGQDRPLITRSWDTFTSGGYNGLGRWGMFMEPHKLVIGMPAISLKTVSISKYNTDSTKIDLLTVDQSGNVQIGTGTTGCLKDGDGTTIAGTCASDIRLKKDIKPISDMLSKVAQLKPVTFRYIDSNSDALNYGLIAQDVEKIMPSLVEMDDNGFKAVRYDTSLQMMSIQSIKELKAENDKLKSQNESLEWRLRTLEAKVDALMK
jgi:hypothetical protein